jgi:hypothetical protein
VRFAAAAPNAAAGITVPYSAIAHLSFQGYATYAEGGDLTP